MLQINNLTLRVEGRRTEIDRAVERVLSRGWFVLGPEVDTFERAFADFLGVTHCISVANGTDAIELALRALGVSSGDRVATVANAGMYTTTSLLAIGAEPLFMDVDLDSKNVTLREVHRALNSGAKTIVVTHLYGLAIPEIAEIASVCRERNVKLLEDCAQAHGARVAGQRVGTFGDAASFSFYPTKNLGALGDGGAVVTDSTEIADEVLLLRRYGWTSKYKVGRFGARNSRLDEMQAAILSVFLSYLDTSNSRRRAIASQYSLSIRHPKIQMPAIHGEESVAHLYVVRTRDRDALREHLGQYGIATDVHYPIPDYRQPLFGDRYADLRLPNTEQLCDEVISLPCFPEMSDAEVNEVITRINAW